MYSPVRVIDPELVDPPATPSTNHVTLLSLATNCCVRVRVNTVVRGLTDVPIVNVSVALSVPPLFVALKVTVDVPELVGVPEINPLASIDKPAGKPVAPKLVGELVAVIRFKNALPTVPLALVALVITGGAGTTLVALVITSGAATTVRIATICMIHCPELRADVAL